MQVSKRILLVNDNKEDTNQIKNMFKNTGVKISSAGSEFGMFNSIEEYGKLADMIMLDLTLQKSNSLDLLGKLRNNEKYKNLPVVVLGDHIAKDTLMKIKELNVSSMVKKPVNKDILLERVRKILNL